MERRRTKRSEDLLFPEKQDGERFHFNTTDAVKTGERKSTGQIEGLDEIEAMFAKKRRKLARDGKPDTPEKGLSDSQTVFKARACILAGQTAFKERVSESAGDWIEDGLGGRYNNEGFTGRVVEGLKVFKAHVLNKPNAGKSKDCPFDCDCCFI